MKVDLTVQIDPALRITLDEGRLSDLVVHTLRMEGVAQPVELGLFVADDQKVRELNRRYRHLDLPTDVLAFGGQGNGFVCPPGHHYLGDIVISYPHARSQAQEVGHSVEEELEFLLVHGLLHLLGYADEREEDRERMWARQAEIWKAFQGR